MSGGYNPFGGKRKPENKKHAPMTDLDQPKSAPVQTSRCGRTVMLADITHDPKLVTCTACAAVTRHWGEC